MRLKLEDAFAVKKSYTLDIPLQRVHFQRQKHAQKAPE